MYSTRALFIVLFSIILLISVNTNVVNGYRKPPFNGSIFGKRGNTGNDYDSNAKALSAMCEIAVEACQTWFQQDKK